MSTGPSESGSPSQAFRRAIDIVGSQSATARLIGLSQQAISERLAKGLPCPTVNGAVLKLETATGISRHVLRPDVYGLAPTADPAAGGNPLEVAR